MRQRVVEEEIEKLVEEARVWRAASHAVWCVWGIVQAKVGPGGAGKEDLPNKSPKGASTVAGSMKNKTDGDEDEFDYLGYAQQRALLFWGDMLALGLAKHEDVDEFIVRNVKRVE